MNALNKYVVKQHLTQELVKSAGLATYLVKRAGYFSDRRKENKLREELHKARGGGSKADLHYLVDELTRRKPIGVSSFSKKGRELRMDDLRKNLANARASKK